MDLLLNNYNRIFTLTNMESLSGFELAAAVFVFRNKTISLGV